jgi:hypothetical protein
MTEPSFYAGNLTRIVKEKFDMKYVGREGDDLLIFQTQAPYLSYDPFQGCSGGPITYSRGRLAALVVEREQEEDRNPRARFDALSFGDRDTVGSKSW